MTVDRLADLEGATLLELLAEREHHREGALAILRRRDRLPVFARHLTKRARRRITAHQDAMRAAHEEILRREQWDAHLAGRDRVLAEHAHPPATPAELDAVDVALARLLEGPAPAEVVPRWDRLRPAIAAIEGMVDDQENAAWLADGLGVYVTELLEAQGVPVRDPVVAYVVLVSAGLFGELAANGIRHGSVDEGTRLAILRIAQTLTAALLPYLPPEART